MFDFHIIDLFEKDSEELKKLQSSFASARFSPGKMAANTTDKKIEVCLLYTSPSPRDQRGSRMPSSA